MDAQLGQMANINLGGYIPAAARQPKIWQQVLAQFLGNMASQAGGAIVDRATSPDISKYDPATQQAGEQPWYRRNFTPQEMVAMRSQSTNKTQGEEKIGIEKTATDANIRQGDEGLDVRRGGLLLQRAGQQQEGDIAGKRLDLAKQELDLARDKYNQSGSQFDKDLLLRKEKLLMDMTGQLFDQGISVGKLNLGAAESERENALLPAKQKALESQATSRDAYAMNSQEKADSARQMRVQTRYFLLDSIQNNSKLTPAQKTQRIQEILSKPLDGRP